MALVPLGSERAAGAQRRGDDSARDGLNSSHEHLDFPIGTEPFISSLPRQGICNLKSTTRFLVKLSMRGLHCRSTVCPVRVVGRDSQPDSNVIDSSLADVRIATVTVHSYVIAKKHPIESHSGTLPSDRIDPLRLPVERRRSWCARSTWRTGCN
jgi:hypothetical protein